MDGIKQKEVCNKNNNMEATWMNVNEDSWWMI